MMRNLRIAALTIAASLLLVGLTVPFGTALAQSKQPLNFKSVDVPLAGVTLTSAIGINAQGDIVGRYAVGAVGHGYLLSDGTYTTIDDPNGDGSSQAQGIKVEDGVYALLDLPSYVMWSDARDINPSGEIVGFFVDAANKTHGFLLRKGEFTTIDFPGEDVVSTQTRGINPQGDIVGLYVSKDALGKLHTHGFVATRNKDKDEGDDK